MATIDADLTDQVEFSELLEAQAVLDAVFGVGDGMEFSDVGFIPSAVFSASLLDGVELSDALVAARLAEASLQDVVQFLDQFDVGGDASAFLSDGLVFDDYTDPASPFAPGWVLNLDTNAPSRYDWPAYNSFAILNGQVYGATEDGIFLLEGDDDFGAKIHWFLMTGKDMLDSALAKNVVRGYLVAKFDGSIYLKTVVGGTETTRTYKLVSTYDELMQRRLPLGKGPRVVRWQFALQDTDGQDIEVDAIAVYPIVLTRRFP